MVILDRSGSMNGWKIVVARRAVARLIDTLDDDDRFAVFAFGSETIAPIDLPYDQLHRATARNRVRACEFSNSISAEGGTEMAQPLELAVALLDDDAPDRDRWIVLITDGQVANEDALVASVADTDAKVAAVGIDDAVNASLLRRLAAQTGGIVEYVDATHRLDDMLDRIHLVIRAPALERVLLEGATLLPNTIVPSAPLNVFPGVPLIVRGRYREALPSLRILARRNGEPFAQAVTAAREPPLALRTCWAREQLLALEDRMVGEPRRRGELATEMTALSLQHGVLCRFTAFVAIDERGNAVPVATRHIAQPVMSSARDQAVREQHERAQDVLAQLELGPSSRARGHRTMCGITRPSVHDQLMSPEAVCGSPITARSLVYSLARLLWELVHGRYLFPTTDNDLDFLNSVVQGKLPSPLAHGALEPVLQRALDRDPQRRYASPGAFARAVEEALPRASAAEVARLLPAIAPAELTRQARWLDRARTLDIPRDGYALIAELEWTAHAQVYLAVRDTAQGRCAYRLRRIFGDLADDRDAKLAVLCAAALAIEGVAPIEDAGYDSDGRELCASPFVIGLTAWQLRDAGAVHPAVASAIVSDAAAALEAMLALPTPNGPVTLIPQTLAMSALHVGRDGRARWTTVGVAPSKQFIVPYRIHVPLVGCDSPSPVQGVAPADGRWQTVPRNLRIDARPAHALQRRPDGAPTPRPHGAATPRPDSPPASPRRSRRRWWQ